MSSRNALLCLLFLSCSPAIYSQVIKFQSIGAGGTTTGMAGDGATIKHSMSVGGAIVSQGTGQAHQAGFFWGNVDFRPASQASDMSFSSVNSSQLTLNFLKGNGSRRIVVAKAESEVDDDLLVDGMGYSANAAFGSGSDLGGGNYVVYDGGVSEGGSVTITNLDLANTIYYFKVFEYNGKYGSNVSNIVYQPGDAVRNPLASPPVTAPSSPAFPAFTNHEMTVEWVNGNGGSRIVLAWTSPLEGTELIDGTTYPVNPDPFGSGAIPKGTKYYVVQNGPEHSVSLTGLLSNTTYYFKIIEYNGSGASSTYSVSSTGEKLTLTDAPIASEAATIGQNSFGASWSEVEGSTKYYVDVSSDGFSTFMSGFDDTEISGTSATITGLDPGVTYEYRVRASNASGQSAHSNTVTALTLPPTPEAIAGTAITTNSFTANWNGVQSATEYFVDVAGNPDFNPLLITNENVGENLSLSVGGLLPGTRYYYRVRAKNESGTSPDSDPYEQITLCTAPIVSDAANVQSTSFKISWAPVTGADSYAYDVSTDELFGTLVVADRPVKDRTEDIITSLNAATLYYYRVRAINAAGPSANSIKKLAFTNDDTGKPVNAPEVSVVDAGASVVKAQLSGGTGRKLLTLKHRPVTGPAFTLEQAMEVSAASQEMPVEAGWLDDLGMEYYFVLSDEAGRSDSSDRAFIYQVVSGGTIPTLSHGGQLKDYRIFSIPYQLEDNDIEVIFDEAGKYEKTRWRLVRYQGGRNVDYTEGLTRIELGKGYWFNAKPKIDINVAGGNVARVSAATPFNLELEQGWNQIGDPFPFAIDWSDIISDPVNAGVSANVDPEMMGWDVSKVNFAAIQQLEPWKGGFVFASQAVTLKVPVALKNTSGGRKKSPGIAGRRLDEAEWFTPIILRQGQTENGYSGFGMHPDADESKDRYDLGVVPRISQYLDMYSYHGDHFYPWFARDVIPTASSHTWNFTVDSNFGEREVDMTWDNVAFGNNDAVLMLYDVGTGMLVDMKRSDGYRFEISGKRAFKIFYGADAHFFRPDIDGLAQAYPNPFSHVVTIPFLVNDDDTYVSIEIFDFYGRKIQELGGDRYGAGYHQLEWDGISGDGGKVSSGFYICAMVVNGRHTGLRSRILKN